MHEKIGNALERQSSLGGSIYRVVRIQEIAQEGNPCELVRLDDMGLVRVRQVSWTCDFAVARDGLGRSCLDMHRLRLAGFTCRASRTRHESIQESIKSIVGQL